MHDAAPEEFREAEGGELRDAISPRAEEFHDRPHLVERQFFAATSDLALAAEAEWGRRIERFVDQRQTGDTDEHEQKAREVLAEEGFTGFAVKVNPGDDTTMRFGIDWGLGDRVAVVFAEQEASAVATGYVLVVNSEGFRLGVKIGGVGKDARQTLDSRVSFLERNSEKGDYAQSLHDHDEDTDWVEITSFGTGFTPYHTGTVWTPRYRRKDGVVFMEGLVDGPEAGSVCNIPTGFRPTSGYVMRAVQNASGGTQRFDIRTDGNVVLGAGATTTLWKSIACSFIADG